DEVAHRASGGEKSLARGGTSNGEGQASRGSTSPRFGGRERRRSRMVSSSAMRAPKYWPGARGIRSRTGLGRTIWPFLGSTVVMVGKSYLRNGFLPRTIPGTGYQSAGLA